MLQRFCQTSIQLVVSVQVQVANNNIIVFYYPTHMLKMKYQMRGDLWWREAEQKKKKRE